MAAALLVQGALTQLDSDGLLRCALGAQIRAEAASVAMEASAEAAKACGALKEVERRVRARPSPLPRGLSFRSAQHK